MSKPGFTFAADNGARFTTDEHGYIKGEVQAGAGDLIARDLEGALDFFSQGLTGSDLLMDLSYRPVRLDGESIVFEVAGDPSAIIESLGLDDLGLDEDGAAPSP